jgi:hypothetical protein
MARCETYDREMARVEMDAQVEARKERAARHVRMARSMQAIAAEMLNSPRYRRKVKQPRDILAYGRVGIELERQICGDTEPPEPTQPPVFVNILERIKEETEALRGKIIKDLIERETQAGRWPPKRVEALPAPAGEVIASTPHPNNATNRGQPPEA